MHEFKTWCEMYRIGFVQGIGARATVLFANTDDVVLVVLRYDSLFSKYLPYPQVMTPWNLPNVVEAVVQLYAELLVEVHPRNLSIGHDIHGFATEPHGEPTDERKRNLGTPRVGSAPEVVVVCEAAVEEGEYVQEHIVVQLENTVVSVLPSPPKDALDLPRQSEDRIVYV